MGNGSGFGDRVKFGGISVRASNRVRDRLIAVRGRDEVGVFGRCWDGVLSSGYRLELGRYWVESESRD